MAVLFITHDLGVIAEIADEVAVMFRGELVEHNTIEELFSDPQHPYTQGLLACRPKLDSKNKRLPTVSDFMQVTETGAGQMHIQPTELSQQRLDELTNRGRGRLLHPESRLMQIGHPWNPGDHDADTRTIEESVAPILQVDDLKVYYPIRQGILMRTVGHVKAVDGISFDIYPGQTLGLVGESGCGKTTAGRAILRLLPLTDGIVTYQQQNLADLSGRDLREIRRQVQIIFQDPYNSLNPRLTVRSVLTEAMSVHGIGTSRRDRVQRAASLLEEVGLESDHLSRYPHEFSGGQRQRICIARALAVEPKFIICDESVSALDVSVQAQVLNLLKELQEERGLTYIFISHDLSVVKFMSDMMAVMEAGKIVEFGPSQTIYAQPKHAYTQRLIESIPNDSLQNIRKRVAHRKTIRDSAG
jgi:peptide/nickel transport system ATP-binding protein